MFSRHALVIVASRLDRRTDTSNLLVQALAAAAYNGLELEVVDTQAMRGDTKKPEYLALFPYGKIPAFKGTDGFSLTESKAISHYSTYYS